MPSGKPIDWDKYVPLMEEHLPNMTIAVWKKKYGKGISSSSIRSKAKSLSIKFKRGTRKRGRHSNYLTETVHSKKGGTIESKSSYETAYIRQLDADPKVKRFKYESISIRYTWRGRPANYIPDFLVERRDGSFEIIEVKPKALLNDKKNQLKFKAAKEGLIPFRIVTEDQLDLT